MIWWCPNVIAAKATSATSQCVGIFSNLMEDKLSSKFQGIACEDFPEHKYATLSWPCHFLSSYMFTNLFESKQHFESFPCPVALWPFIKLNPTIINCVYDGWIPLLLPLLHAVWTPKDPLVVKHSLLTHIMTGCWIVLTPPLRPQLTGNTLGWSHKKSQSHKLWPVYCINMPGPIWLHLIYFIE